MDDTKINTCLDNNELKNTNAKKWTQFGQISYNDDPKALNCMNCMKIIKNYKLKRRKFIERIKIWLYDPSSVGKAFVVGKTLKNVYFKSLSEA